MTPQDLAATLARFPRASLGFLPTPLERLDNLSAAIGGATIYAKRDDMTGLAMGGNKVRQLEYYLGAAKAENADTVLITGAVQSNFVRAAAAGARKLGMDIHIQLEERVPNPDPTYRANGNVLLDKLLGAHLHSYPEGEDEAGADRALGALADSLKAEGKRPFIVPLSGDRPPKGAMGYVQAALEIAEDMENQTLKIDEVIVASGSALTHVGLLFGLRAININIPVIGACVRRDAEAQHQRVTKRLQDLAELMELPNPVQPEDIVLNDSALPPGYGQLGPDAKAALEAIAQTEGQFVDPVYTAKVLAVAIDRAKELGSDKSVLFIHTGGQPALFGYAEKMGLV